MQPIVNKVPVVQFRQYDGTDIEAFKSWYMGLSYMQMSGVVFDSEVDGVLTFHTDMISAITIRPGDWMNLDSLYYPVSPEDMAIRWGNPGV